MDSKDQRFLTAETIVNADLATVWKLWNSPDAIKQWNNLSNDWYCPEASNDLQPGGKFLYVMGLKDGSFQFNFEGTYETIKTRELITYTLDDGRQSVIAFSNSNPVKITENFQADPNQPADMQLQYCQAVLKSFKNFVEKGNDA